MARDWLEDAVTFRSFEGIVESVWLDDSATRNWLKDREPLAGLDDGVTSKWLDDIVALDMADGMVKLDIGEALEDELVAPIHDKGQKCYQL